MSVADYRLDPGGDGAIVVCGKGDRDKGVKIPLIVLILYDVYISRDDADVLSAIVGIKAGIDAGSARKTKQGD